MKKIIAAALSVLVGAFGYNIVDKAIEDRVTSLESEVVELREEVSKYHSQYSTKFTTKSPPTTSQKTTRKTTTHIYNTTKENYETTKNTLTVGDYLKESSASLHKFLVREYTYGNFKFIPPENYEPVSFVTRPTTTTRPVTTTRQITTTQPTTILADYSKSDDPADVFTTVVLNGIIEKTTMPNAPVADYYINITESSAQVTKITEDVSYTYSYDNDYSMVSTPINKTITSVTVSCKGYTDSALAGKKIDLSTDLGLLWFENDTSKKIINNTINPDGSFEYKAIVSTEHSLRPTTNYRFYSINIY